MEGSGRFETKHYPDATDGNWHLIAVDGDMELVAQWIADTKPTPTPETKPTATSDAKPAPASPAAGNANSPQTGDTIGLLLC